MNATATAKQYFIPLKSKYDLGVAFEATPIFTNEYFSNFACIGNTKKSPLTYIGVCAIIDITVKC